MESTLTDRINDFYSTWAINGYGALGSNPYEIGRVLTRNGIDYTRVDINEMSGSGVYIISYWTGKKLRSPLHTIAVFYDGTEYTAYNLYGYGNTDTIDPADYENLYICGYYLGGTP